GVTRFAAAASTVSAGLVGREAERAVLDAALAQARGGQGGALLLHGEAGIGKSRLAASLAEAVPGAVALQCSPQHQGTALHPVVEWLAGTTGRGAEAGPEVRLAALRAMPGIAEQAIPAVASLLGLDTGEAAPPDASQWREAILGALHALLADGADSDLRLLLVEDLHWADTLTLELLARLAATAAERKLLLLLTSRQAHEGGLLATTPLRRVPLDRLTPEGAAAMLDALPGGHRLPGSVRTAIITRAGGVPLFLQEIALSVLNAAADAPPGETPEVPLTLRDALMARLDLLGSGKQVAQVAAVLGPEVPLPLLAAAAGLPEPMLEEAARTLVQSGLMEWRDRAAAQALGFHHALIRDVAYGSILKAVRTQLHARAAQLLEGEFATLAGDQPELVATHWTNAGEAGRAIPLWIQAAEQARARSAAVEEVRHIETALDLLARTPATPERDAEELALRLKLATPLVPVAGWGSPRSANNAQRIAELLDTDQPTLPALQLVWIQGVGALLRSEQTASIALGERLIAMAQRSKLPNLPIMGHRVAGYAHLMFGELAKAERHMVDGLAGYAPDGFDSCIECSPMDLLVCAAAQNAILFALQARYVRLRESCDLVWRRIASLDSPASYNYVLLHQTLHDLVLRDFAKAEERCRELKTLAERQPIYHFYVQLETGWLAARAGALDDGLARLRAAAQSFDGQHSRLWVPYFMMLHAEMLIGAGRHADALDLLGTIAADCETLEQHFHDAEVHRLRAHALAGLGAAPVEVEAARDAAMEIARRQGARLYLLRIAADRARRLQAAGADADAARLVCDVLAEAPEAKGFAEHA
ncbi:ATP-binding protein, partial [Falsiroseomonas oryzae]|uniref:ATP-binding protein n=1 Tax=Falsiroseomonas oryzae TaxID=2766473 RepID=UPI0022EB5747